MTLRALIMLALSAAAPVVPERPVELPRDYGSHPQFRTEWWYVTGWLTSAGGPNSGGVPLGFQVTFFRTRPDLKADNPSAFTPRQVLIAHAALSDPAHGRLWKDQRIARAGFGLVEASTTDTAVRIDRWRLERRAAGAVAGTPARYLAVIPGSDFELDLSLTPTQPDLLNGDRGYSRKGPDPRSASYYYSAPHLAVRGTILRNGRREAVTGEAWLDHEWSSEYLDAASSGWDWIGLNLDDGGALMAFRIRDRVGAVRWAGGTLRGRDGATRVLGPGDLSFTPGRLWRSPRTGIVYPVAWTVRAGELTLGLEPLMDDQESDTRMSTGAIYWEGAVRVHEGTLPAGHGYLELTGYGEPLRLR